MSTQAKLGTALLHNLIKLREQKGEVRIEDVGQMLEGIASTFHHETENTKADAFIRNEIQKMADYITEAKKEISGPGGGPLGIVGLNAEDLTDDQLAAILKVDDVADEA